MQNKNKLKNVCILLITVLMVLSTTIVTGNTAPTIRVTICSLPERGNTLIADTFNIRVIEVDDDGTIVWEKTGLYYPYDAERLSNGNTLIAIDEENKVIEVDYNGTIVWEKTGLYYPYDAKRLDNGNTLIAESNANRVIEVDYNGNIVWQKTELNFPWDAERLSNGNTLIAEVDGHRVIEVDYNGTVVWEKTGLYWPNDAERLVNGNTLIADGGDNRVIEVDYNGTIVWQVNVSMPYDADRLDNGNTLIAESNANRVIEIDYNGNIVWQKTGLVAFDAERVNRPPYTPVVVSPFDGATDIGINVNLSWTGGDPDPGNTVTYDIYLGTTFPPQYHGTAGPHPGDPSYVVTYDPGTLDLFTTYYWKIVATDNHGASTEGPVWSFTTLENGPPSNPIINGPTSGVPKVTYSYTFVSIDPDGNDVFYEIDWGDGQFDPWDGPHESNEKITRSHSWESQGAFTIMARSKDIHGAISGWGILEVTIPRIKAFNFHFNLLNWLFEHFQMHFLFYKSC